MAMRLFFWFCFFIFYGLVLGACNNPVYFHDAKDGLEEDSPQPIRIGDRRWKQDFSLDETFIRWPRHMMDPQGGPARSSHFFAANGGVGFRSLTGYYSKLSDPPSAAGETTRRFLASPPGEELSTPPLSENFLPAPSEQRILAQNRPENSSANRLANRANRIMELNTHQNGQVDIVFMVDTSRSMTSFLLSVQETFKHFIQALEPLDWRIIFVNADKPASRFYKKSFFNKFFLFPSDYHDGHVIPLELDGDIFYQPAYLSKDLKDYESIFIDTLSHHPFNQHTDYGENYVDYCELPPGCGEGYEKPLTHLAMFLQNRQEYLRPFAGKAVVLISDSDEEHHAQWPGAKSQEVVQVFKHWYKLNKLTAYGIIVRPGDAKCRSAYGRYPDDNIYGVQLSRLAQLTGGVNFSICDSHYTPLAAQITADFK